MEKKTAEKVLDNNCKAVYGFNKSKENSRIYERKDIITAMEEYSSLQSEEKDKEIVWLKTCINWNEQTFKDLNEKNQTLSEEIERLREALKGVVDCWECESLLTDAVVSQAKVAISNHPQALSNQPIESDKERLYDLCKKCEGKGFIEWVPSVTNKDTPLRERIAIAVVTPLCKSAVDPEEVSDAVLEEVQPIIEAKDRRIKELEELLENIQKQIKLLTHN